MMQKIPPRPEQLQPIMSRLSLPLSVNVQQPKLWTVLWDSKSAMVTDDDLAC
jgi:hypothetical protein